MTLFNWLFVPIAFSFGIGAALFLCGIVLRVFESLLSAFTTMFELAPSPLLDEVLVSAALCIGCIIGAAITVLLPALSAPKYKKEIAQVVFVLGAAISGALFLFIGRTAPYLAALGGGIASVLYVARVSRLQPAISFGTDTPQENVSARSLPPAGLL